MSALRERNVEQYLVKRCAAVGALTRKVQWVGRNGAPDRVVMLANGTVVWVELKAPGLAAAFPSNAHERQQHREHERMRAAGQWVCVLDSFNMIDAVIR